jgi:hypothetical protein
MHQTRIVFRSPGGMGVPGKIIGLGVAHIVRCLGRVYLLRVRLSTTPRYL